MADKVTNMFRTTLAAASAALTLALSGPALAAGAGGEVTDVEFSFEGPFGAYDRFQLQRGFQIYQQVCSGCHGMKYVSFRSLGEPGGPEFPDEQVRAIAAEYEVVDPNTGELRPGKPSDKFPANDALGAPDMSLLAKARAGFHGPYGTGISQLVNGIGGPEYIYSLLLGYNDKDEEVGSAYLYGNDIYPGGLINMAPPLYGDDVEYLIYGSDAETADYIPPEPTLEQEAKDVAAFLMWAAEPKLVDRKEAGIRNFLMLAVLAVLLYYTNKQIWASVKGKET
ncbi:MAG: cytochrome c1 [Pseudomonadota bacterium]